MNKQIIITRKDLPTPDQDTLSKIHQLGRTVKHKIVCGANSKEHLMNALTIASELNLNQDIDVHVFGESCIVFVELSEENAARVLDAYDVMQGFSTGRL